GTCYPDLAIDEMASRKCGMQAHDGILARLADKPGLLPIKGAPMLMLADTRGKLETLPQGRAIKAAVKIDPLAAVIAPRLPAQGFFDTARQDFLLQRAQMLADHRPIPLAPQKSERLGYDVFHRQAIFF